MDEVEWESIRETLRYDKGENRHKHSGHHAEAQMVYKGGAWVGECPKGFDLAVALNLVQQGVPEFRNTTEERPYRIWSYHAGAIYASRTQDGGTTWHGYPSGHPSDAPPRPILRQLEARALELGEEALIKQWLKRRWNK